MTSIGEISVTLRLNDQLTGQLKSVGTQLSSFGKKVGGKTGGFGVNIDTSGATKDFGIFMKRIDAGIYGTQGSFSNLNESGKSMANGIAASGKQMTASIGEGVAKSTKHLTGFGQFVHHIGNYISFSIGVQMVMGLKQAVISMIDIFRRYEKSIVNAAAVSGYLGKSFDTAKNSIDAMTRELAGKTIFTATEVAEAMYNIASAGIDPVTSSVEELIPILQYAQANQTNLATATQDLLTVLKQFRLGLEDLGIVTDTFTTLIASSFLTADKLANAFQYVGQVAGELNQDFRDVASAIALLSDRGYEGGQAGERLNMIFTQLLDPTAETKKTVAALGLSLTDLDPTTNNIIDIFKRLKEANFTAADSAAMFRARTASAMLTLVNSVDAIEEYVRVSKELSGITEMIAEKQMETLEGKIKDMQGAFEEAGIIIGGKFTDALNTIKDTADSVSSSLKGIGIPESVMSFVGKLAEMMFPILALLKILKIFQVAVLDINKATADWAKSLIVGKDGLNAYQTALKALNNEDDNALGALQKYQTALGIVMGLRGQLSAFITEEARQTEEYQQLTLDLVNAELALTESENNVISTSGKILDVFINQNAAVADVISQYNNYKKASSEKVQLDASIASYTQDLIDLQQELSRVTSIYGADSEEVNAVLNQYTTTSHLLTLSQEELATKTTAANDANKIYNDLLNELPPQLRATADAAISLINLRGILFDKQIEYNSALTEYNRLLDIQTNREKYLSEAYLNVYDAQDKLWEIEQKRYDLKEDEESLGQDLFDALAEQGLLTDDIITQYTEWQQAEGELAGARAAYARGDITEEQLAEYIKNARKEYEDYAGVAKDTTQEYVDMGVASNDVADTLYDMYDISNDEAETLKEWEDAVDAVNDAMSRVEDIKLVSDEDITAAKMKVDGLIIDVNTAFGNLQAFKIPIDTTTPLAEAEAKFTAWSSKVSKEVTDDATTLLGTIEGIFSGKLWDFLVKLPGDLVTKIATGCNTVWNAIITYLSSIPGNIWGFLLKLGTGILNTISTTANTIWVIVTSKLSSVGANIWDWITKIGGGFWNGIRDIAGSIWDSIVEIFSGKGGIYGAQRGGIFGAQKGIKETKGPQFSMIGEAGREAVVPLVGMNRKYGEEILRYIIPKYYPDLLALQGGGMVGGGRSVSYGGDTNQNENFTITGPINITGIQNVEEFGEKLKFAMRRSK